MSERLTQTEARRIIFRLRSGTASEESVRAVSVGTKHILKRLREGVEQCSNGDGAGAAAFVEADWGFGKSHTRMLLSGHLREAETPFIYACTDARGASLAHIHRAVPNWLEELRIGSVCGLRPAYESGVLSDASIRKWAVRDNSELAFSMRWILNGWGDDWMRALGHYYSTPDYSYQHPKALRLIKSVANMLHAAGHGGLVMLLDEVENIDRHTDIRGRRKSYATLELLRRHPHIFPVLFVTERFFERTDSDFEKGDDMGWWRWPQEAVDFLECIDACDILHPPRLSDQRALKLVERIEDVYGMAYRVGATLPVGQILQYWRRTATRSIRLLVRLTVNELDLRAQRQARLARC